ncbi:MAG: hypothetical protein AAF609_25025 [Cyanobacteria bacterium P01_C01_bin.120]
MRYRNKFFGRAEAAGGQWGPNGLTGLADVHSKLGRRWAAPAGYALGGV